MTTTEFDFTSLFDLTLFTSDYFPTDLVFLILFETSWITGDYGDSFASGSSATLIGLRAFILRLSPLKPLPSLKKARRYLD